MCNPTGMDIYKHVTKNMGGTLAGVDKMLWETYSIHLFFGDSKSLSLIVGNLIVMTVKKAGIWIHSPVMSAKNRYVSLQHAITDLI